MKWVRQSYRLGGHVAIKQTLPVSERPCPFPPMPDPVAKRGRGSLWGWSCDMLAAGLVGAVFWLSRVKGCPCGDPYCVKERDD